MNRTYLLGIALGVAVLGIARLGNETPAVAGDACATAVCAATASDTSAPATCHAKRSRKVRTSKPKTCEPKTCDPKRLFHSRPLALEPGCRCTGDGNPARLTSGMVSWWPGNGTASDAVGPNSGDPKHGVLYAKGRVGQGFVFDGDKSYVHVPNSSSLDLTNDITIDAWIFPTADVSHATVIGKWGDLGAWGSQRSFWLGVNAGGRLVFSLSDDIHQQDGDFHALVSEPGVIPLNTWSHVAAVFDHETGQRRAYVNGNQVAERIDPPFKIHSSIADVTIGAWLRSPDVLGFQFTGSIDEIHIFNRVLTESEIKDLSRLRMTPRTK